MTWQAHNGSQLHKKAFIIINLWYMWKSPFVNWNECLHLPFSTGIQQDYTQCCASLLHAEHDPLHTHTVFRSVRLWSINSYQVIPPSLLIAMTRIVEKTCQEWLNTYLVTDLQDLESSHFALHIFCNPGITNEECLEHLSERLHRGANTGHIYTVYVSKHMLSFFPSFALLSTKEYHD